MTMMTGQTLPRIQAFLEASGLAFEVWPCDDALADTAGAYIMGKNRRNFSHYDDSSP